MPRGKYTVIIAAVGTVAVIAVAITAFTSATYTGAAATGTPNVPTAGWSPTLPPALRTPPRPASWTVVPPTISARDGIPAITPSLATGNPQAARLTEQDARRFVAKDRPNGVITKVVFVTVEQALATMQISMPFDRNELLCIVALNQSGTVPGANPPTPYQTVYEIFSAQTGNLLSELFRERLHCGNATAMRPGLA